MASTTADNSETTQPPATRGETTSSSAIQWQCQDDDDDSERKRKKDPPKKGETIAVRWKLKDTDENRTHNRKHQWFLAKVVTAMDPNKKCFGVEYTGYTAQSGDKNGVIYMDDEDEQNSLPWHHVDAKRSTSAKRIKELREGDRILLHHLEDGQPPVLYESIVNKINKSGLTLFDLAFQEFDQYTFKSMRQEVWHKIPK